MPWQHVQIHMHATSNPQQFDGVLENVSQDAVYTAAAQEAVDAVLQGFNATVFCYGQVRCGRLQLHGDSGRAVLLLMAARRGTCMLRPPRMVAYSLLLWVPDIGC